MFTLFGALIGTVLFKGGLSATGEFHKWVKSELRKQEESRLAATLQPPPGTRVLEYTLKGVYLEGQQPPPDCLAERLNEIGSTRELTPAEAASVCVLEKDMTRRSVRQ